ncbi:hypothetical protein SAMD00023353_9600010 [Rosellinia necatrix]|uniref:Uncharacterized protein n=1 Tax=Rosellinia necatrix TaxID=77044 RepID=A0A1W2TVN5_ROSNE|nr:hypothetical protein SAMD00023353_9600010 [Rosellinia necatrix]
MAPNAGAVQYDDYYGAQPSTPAWCFYQKGITDALYHEGNINEGPVSHTGSFQITVAAIVILGLSFVTRLLKLFETTSRFLADKIRMPMSRHLRKVLAYCVKLRLAPQAHRSGFKGRIVLWEYPLLACYLYLRMVVDIYASVFSDIVWVLLSAIFGTKQLSAQRALLDEPNNIYDFGQILPIAMLVAAILTIRQSFMSGRKPPNLAPTINGCLFSGESFGSPLSLGSMGSNAITFTADSGGGKGSRVYSANSIPPLSPPSTTATLEDFLSQAKYVEATWLLPTLFNIAVAIFLFFQLIASSGGGDAKDLLVSIIICFLIVSVACCAVILVGFTVDDYRWASWVIWTFAMQPFGAMVLLSRQVMTHEVSLSDLDPAWSLVIYLVSATFILGVEYLSIYTVVACCGRPLGHL